jgi:hypothetical protein
VQSVARLQPIFHLYEGFFWHHLLNKCSFIILIPAIESRNLYCGSFLGKNIHNLMSPMWMKMDLGKETFSYHRSITSVCNLVSIQPDYSIMSNKRMQLIIIIIKYYLKFFYFEILIFKPLSSSIYACDLIAFLVIP